jgi:ubiquitin-protein ligase E3 C
VGSPRSSEDILRLLYFCNVFEKTFHALPTIATEGEWTELLKRLSSAVLYALGSAMNTPTHGEAVLPLLRTVVFLVDLIPKKMAMIANTYYRSMAHLSKNLVSLSGNLAPEHVVNAVCALLRPITSETMAAYEAFAISYLTVPDLAGYLGGLDGLAHQINYKVLASAVGTCMHPAKESSRVLQDIKAQTWLLAYLIYFHRYALGGQANLGDPDLEFLAVVSELLNSTAAYLTRCLETEESNETDSSNGPSLHPFVKDQVTSLANQSSITGLLSRIRPANPAQTDFSNSESDSSKEAKILATYALNLLRVFPRRGDDIRMWLYLGSAPSGDNASGQPGAKIPAIKYFWQASRSSRIFDIITNKPTKVLSLLEIPKLGSHIEISQEDRDQEWTTILLFFELYTFLLKVMDDEEFFSSASPFTASSNTKSSWTKESALPLEDVKAMTVFLKNLAFTLYWNFAALSDKGPVPSSTGDLKSYFNTASQVPEQTERFNDSQVKGQPNDLPGVTGIPLDYFKGLVTGLLRMLHERE